MHARPSAGDLPTRMVGPSAACTRVCRARFLCFSSRFSATLLQHGLDLGQLARLGDVVEGAQAHGLDGRLHAGVAGHHDRFGVRRHLLELLEHLDAGHAGHAQIEDGGVEGALFQRLEGGPAVGADGDLVAQARQLGAHELLQRLLVIDEQDAQAVVRRRGQALLLVRMHCLVPRWRVRDSRLIRPHSARRAGIRRLAGDQHSGAAGVGLVRSDLLSSAGAASAAAR